jgi:hypothetical protein
MKEGAEYVALALRPGVLAAGYQPSGDARRHGRSDEGGAAGAGRICRPSSQWAGPPESAAAFVTYPGLLNSALRRMITGPESQVPAVVVPQDEAQTAAAGNPRRQLSVLRDIEGRRQGVARHPRAVGQTALGLDTGQATTGQVRGITAPNVADVVGSYGE